MLPKSTARLAALLFLSPVALAQQSPAPTSPSGVAAPATMLGDYWWLVLVALGIVLTIWYAPRRRR